MAELRKDWLEQVENVRRGRIGIQFSIEDLNDLAVRLQDIAEWERREAFGAARETGAYICGGVLTRFCNYDDYLKSRGEK